MIGSYDRSIVGSYGGDAMGDIGDGAFDDGSLVEYTEELVMLRMCAPPVIL